VWRPKMGAHFPDPWSRVIAHGGHPAGLPFGLDPQPSNQTKHHSGPCDSPPALQHHRPRRPYGHLAQRSLIRGRASHPCCRAHQHRLQTSDRACLRLVLCLLCDLRPRKSTVDVGVAAARWMENGVVVERTEYRVGCLATGSQGWQEEELAGRGQARRGTRYHRGFRSTRGRSLGSTCRSSR
jgi:hypothetical protein